MNTDSTTLRQADWGPIFAFRRAVRIVARGAMQRTNPHRAALDEALLHSHLLAAEAELYRHIRDRLDPLERFVLAGIIGDDDVLLVEARAQADELERRALTVRAQIAALPALEAEVVELLPAFAFDSLPIRRVCRARVARMFKRARRCSTVQRTPRARARARSRRCAAATPPKSTADPDGDGEPPRARARQATSGGVA